MNQLIKDMQNEINREEIMELFQIVREYHVNTNKNIDDSIQKGMKIINDAPSKGLKSLLTEKFESILHDNAEALLRCIKAQESLIELINHQIQREFGSVPVHQECIFQLFEMKKTVSDKKNLNQTKIKEMQKTC